MGLRGGSKVTFADRQQQVRIPGVKLQLVDGVSMTDVVLQPEMSLSYSGGTPSGALQGRLRSTLMHCMVMWLMIRMMPREPATASRGWLVLVSYVHAHV